MATPRTISPRPHPTAFHFTPSDHVGLSVLTDDAIMARFDSRVNELDGCHVWMGRCTNDQPRFWFSTGGQTGREVLAVRMAWTRVHGPIPEGYVIRHSCPTKACVKVGHLFLTLPVGNVRETQRQGRWHRTNLTTCPLGHPYADANLVLDGGARKCRECKNARVAADRIENPDRYYDYDRAEWQRIVADPERHAQVKAEHRRWEAAHRAELNARRRERRHARRQENHAA